jgi:class 3 adenylate cyclase/tetratricopeptide (TPR) repeat protein
MQVCPRCGDENSDRARFCQTCGGALDALTGSREVRKRVTVLFMDVVGSTEMGERSDPESIRRVMSRLFDVVKPVLEHHGGTVEKFIGDAVMAVFGIPTVHEDDALRACRAALEIQEEIARLNKELERDVGITVSTRTGLNTGEVVAGDPSSGQALVTGDPVNAAARLEQSAQPGTVVIGEPTYRLVAHAVNVEPVEPIIAKGKAAPLPAYRLLSIVPGTPRAQRLASPMVGRERELRELQKAFGRSMTDQTCVLVTVFGEPGVGKSRLAKEFVESLSRRAAVLSGRCLPYGDGITFWPISENVRQAAQIKEDDSPEEATFRVGALLPETEQRDVIQNRVAAALGLSEGAGAIQETFWAIRKLFEALGRDRPLVVLYDDIQWAEPAFLDLIEYLEGWSDGTPILLLCLSRPELLEARPEWATTATHAVTVRLEPLIAAECAHLVDGLLGQVPPPTEFRHRIAEATQGNPLFVEEMLRMFIDEGLLRQEEGRWVVSGDLSSIPTPPSIQGLLAARIEQLPEEQRTVLQRASVIGEVFWWGAVVELSPSSIRGRVGSQLQAMVRRGLIGPDEIIFAGEDSFRFRHMLIRDAAYNSLPKTTRADLHERFAVWMERIVGERVEEYEEILGYHLEQAYRQRLARSPSSDQELADRAAGFLASAGVRALDRGDIKAALNLLTRASHLNPTEEPGSLSIRLSLAEALSSAGELRRAEELLSELILRAMALGDRAAEWRAKVQQARILAETGTDVEMDADRIAERAIEVFSELGDEWGLSRAWELLGWLDSNSGQTDDAQKAHAKAAAHARLAGDTAGELWGLVDVASEATFGRMPVEQALVLCRDTLDRVKGQPWHEAEVHRSRCQLEAMRGNLDEARAAAEQARTAFRDLGNAHSLASVTIQAAMVAASSGDVVGWERELRSGYETFSKMGAKGYVATWAARLAMPLIELGRDDESMRLTIESEELAAKGDITAQVPWRMARARVLARRGATEEAERLARQGVAIAERTDLLNLRGDALADLAEVLRLAGRSSDAADAAREAVNRFELKGNLTGAVRTRALLERLVASKQA